MTARVAACVLGLITMGVAPGATAQSRPVVATLRLPDGLVVDDAMTVDVDGDGLDDLVLACHGGDPLRRELRLHQRRAGPVAFVAEPMRTPYRVERDVIAAGFADLDGKPGRDLVLAAAEQIVAVNDAADGPRYRQLFAARLLWPAPEPTRVALLPQLVTDIDGDRLPDVAVPEPDGHRLVLARRDGDAIAFDRVRSLRLPASAAPPPGAALTAAGAAARRGELRLSFAWNDGSPGAAGDLLALQTASPPLLLADFDGDGRRDAIAVHDDALLVWQQAAGGGFPNEPSQRHALPWPADRLQWFDPARDVQLADLDGDGRLDLVLTSSARADDAVEVRIESFRQQQDGAFPARAEARLRLQSLAQPAQLVDADGDGSLDLFVVSLRTDRLRGLGGGDGPTALQAQAHLFRGAASGFVVPAAFARPLELPVRNDRDLRPFVRLLPPAAGEPPALCWRDGRESVVLQPLRQDGRSWALLPPRWRLQIGADARLLRLPGDGAELVVLDGGEVLHVRCR